MFIQFGENYAIEKKISISETLSLKVKQKIGLSVLLNRIYDDFIDIRRVHPFLFLSFFFFLS